MAQRHDLIFSTRGSLVETQPAWPEAGAAGGGLRATGPSRRPVYRPLVIGPAVLYRLPTTTSTAGPGSHSLRRPLWQVDLEPGGRLRPAAPVDATGIERVVAWRRRTGSCARVGAALVSSCDFASAEAGAVSDAEPSHDGIDSAGTASRGPAANGRFRKEGASRGMAAEIYGWALMYQLPGMIDRAVIEPHDEFDSLPAYYESPLEIVDRTAFLADRGIPCRAIALLTRPDDFEHAAGDASSPVHRHFPHTRFQRPADLRRLFLLGKAGRKPDGER
jgi:hypothetical protein